MITEIKKTDPVKNGDRLILTYNILNPLQMFASLFNPIAIGTQKDEAIIKTINELKVRSNELGFRIVDYSIDGNKLKIQVDVIDSKKISNKSGLGEPVTTTIVVVEAIAFVIVAGALAWGVTLSLSKVEKITSNPMIGIAIIGIVGIVLIRELGLKRR